MSMSKKDFIALADAIKEHNSAANHPESHMIPVPESTVNMLADFCRSQNPNFKRERWLSYIAGECGPNGGKVTKE